MKFSKSPLAQTITQLCFAKNIKYIVICPGSRNAPLTIGFSENKNFTCYSIVDERSAAFFALGLAQQLKHPVAVVCTSGSAVLNFYPAVAEAFYSDISLVLISADRPAAFIDIGDGQTIRQENVFARHTLYSANLQAGPENRVFNETQLNIALNTSIELNGPVHINAPFEEPLYEKVEAIKHRPQHVPARVINPDLNDDLKSYLKVWNKAKRKMVLVGVLAPDSVETKWLQQLSEDKSVLVLTETTSNLHHPDFINSIDQLIAPLSQKEFEALRPEVLLTLGGMVVSKKIKAFLRKFQPRHHWHIDEKKAYDTYFCLEKHFKVKPNTFFSSFLPETKKIKSDYQNFWLQLKSQRKKRHDEYLTSVPFSDFKVFSLLLNALPDGYQLQLSNSAAVRYAQLFNLKESVSVFCNRGTSGIDGSTSTAVGAAVASTENVTLITGDLSFFYDSNALWNRYIPSSFRIVVVNNSGGGIFRILPGQKDTPEFESYFETVHSLSARHLCEMYGFEYSKAEDEMSLVEKINNFYEESDRPKLIEVFTPRTVNDKVLLDYFPYLK